MFKRLISCFFTAGICLLVTCGMSALAYDEQSVSSDVFLIQTEQCPQPIIDYAISSFEGLLEAFSTNNNNVQGEVKLGSPYKIFYQNEEIIAYNFPVFEGEQICATLTVAHEVGSSTYHAQMSADNLTVYLNKLRNSRQNVAEPMLIASTGTEFVAFNDTAQIVLEQSDQASGYADAMPLETLKTEVSQSAVPIVTQNLKDYLATSQVEAAPRYSVNPLCR